MRRLFLVLPGLVALLALPLRASAHAGLVAAAPAAGARLTTPPAELRLRFSEAIESSLAAIELVDGRGVVTRLDVRLDAHDGRTALAALPALAAGTWRVVWRVVSADGHASHGSYHFTVSAGAAAARARGAPSAAASGTPGSTIPASMAAASDHEMPAATPPGAALLRGLAALALMAAAGVLALTPWAPAPAAAPASRRLGIWLTAAALVFMLADSVAWAAYAAGGLDGGDLRALLATMPGRIVVARLVLVALALWIGGGARRTGVAAGLALAAVAAGAVLGHPATVHPLVAAPLKLVHVVAVSAWLGGVLLLARSVMDREGAVAAAGRVSALALVAAFAVGTTGALLAFLFVDHPAELVSTGYGRLVLLKLLGMGLLLGFGAVHRMHLIPRLRIGEALRIRAALRAELAVFALVVLAAGFLAYAPLPAEAVRAAANAPGANVGR